MNPQEINRNRWNELAPIHARSDYYGVDRFIADKTYSSLSVIEQAEIGDINGKALLHLQCHIGVDTLSLGRKGAIVTGVDFSSESIAQAQAISQKTGEPARFITANVYDVPHVMQEQFDIVYSNWGSICWLNDLSEWGKVINHSLKPGGMVYVADIHPMGLLYGHDAENAGQKTASYFPSRDNQAQQIAFNGTYTDPHVDLKNTVYHQWTHTVGEIINSVTQNGMNLAYFNEHAVATYEQLPGMERLENGLYKRPDNKAQIPLSFTLKAYKNG